MKIVIKILLLNKKKIFKVKIFSERNFFLKSNSSEIVFDFYKKFSIELIKDVFILYLCVDSITSLKYFELLKDKNIFIIDKSSALRTNKKIPLIVSGINDLEIKINKKFISNPNCVVIPLAHIINVFKNFKIISIVINTFQSVSGAGNNGVYELENQYKNFFLKNNISSISFKEPIFLNLLPYIPDRSLIDNKGFSEEEEKIHSELLKVLKKTDIKYYINCTRVPIINCHSFFLNFFFDQKINLEEIIKIINLNKNIKILNDNVNNIFPNPFYSNFTDLILLGRIKVKQNSLSFFCCANNLRFGTILNVMKITDYLIKNFNK